jgi:hypothetical protein
VNKDAARALIVISPTMTEYEQMDDEKDAIWIVSGTKSTDTTGIGDLANCGGSSPTKYIPPDIIMDEDHRRD